MASSAVARGDDAGRLDPEKSRQGSLPRPRPATSGGASSGRWLRQHSSGGVARGDGTHVSGRALRPLMVVVVVTVDVLFFRHHFWERLAVNLGIVLMSVAFYLSFPRRR
jgi:hypothetical protein